jgi:hypothetical protein
MAHSEEPRLLKAFPDRGCVFMTFEATGGKLRSEKAGTRWVGLLYCVSESTSSGNAWCVHYGTSAGYNTQDWATSLV